MVFVFRKCVRLSFLETSNTVLSFNGQNLRSRIGDLSDLPKVIQLN